MSSSLNPYFIGLSILIIEIAEVVLKIDMSQSLFYWIIYSYFVGLSEDQQMLGKGLNPYFIGLSILICVVIDVSSNLTRKSQSLFYWIIYSYKEEKKMDLEERSVSILILLDYLFLQMISGALKKDSSVSILILLDYLFL